MDYREYKKKLMKDPEFRKAYKMLQAEYQYRREEAHQRTKHQTDLAKELGITVEELVEDLFSLFPNASMGH